MKTYAVKEQLPAADLNSIVKSAGVYGASSEGDDGYTIAAVPTPTSLATGDEYSFLADVGCTGASTFNPGGGLGDTAIKKLVNGALLDTATGDIVAGGIYRVVYDGTYFVLRNQVPNLIASGQGSRTSGDGTGNETIAHGLGVVPRLFKITYFQAPAGTSENCHGSGAATGTGNQSCSYVVAVDSSADVPGQSGTKVVKTINGASTTLWEGAVTTMDDTDIVIDFTTAGGQTLYYQWEAYA